MRVGIRNVDMLLNIREYHNFDAQDKTKLNKATFDALKPSGIYVIVDHSRRHMAPETHELRRREDAVKIILEVQAAGFVLNKSSDKFYRPDDALTFEIHSHTVASCYL
ncbi:MAG: putative methyltransferase [Gammaproteobacteria bacterium]|jgi:predicted methyltransferase